MSFKTLTNQQIKLFLESSHLHLCDFAEVSSEHFNVIGRLVWEPIFSSLVIQIDKVPSLLFMEGGSKTCFRLFF